MIVQELSLFIQQVCCILNIETICLYWSKTVSRCYKHSSCVSVAFVSEPLIDTRLVTSTALSDYYRNRIKKLKWKNIMDAGKTSGKKELYKSELISFYFSD